jgi:hypothetical protein
MTALYWFALVVGAGMYLFSLAADFSGHADVGDVHSDGDANHGDGEHGVHGYNILSVRNATYFLFAFGVTGVLLSLVWGGERDGLTALLAVLLGAAGGAISTFAFGWVRRTESGYLPDDRGWLGLTGRVVLPLSTEGTGKILVSRQGREHELLARPFEQDAEAPHRWSNVMVIEMRDGVALVQPNDSALDHPEMLRIPPTLES